MFNLTEGEGFIGCDLNEYFTKYTQMLHTLGAYSL